MDCVAATHAARRGGCAEKRGDAYDACLRRHGLRAESEDLANEVVCRTDGNTKVYYLAYEGGGGQVQRVHGMPLRGQPTRLG